MPATEWRKSSFSDDAAGSCVEVALTRADVSVRDSKDPVGRVVRLPAGAWRRLVAEWSGAVDS
jgi:uncharacterized protein DUF397